MRPLSAIALVLFAIVGFSHQGWCAQEPVAPAGERKAAKPGASPSLGLLDLPGWVSAHGRAFAIRERTYDPFLLPKDPSKFVQPAPIQPRGPDGEPDAAGTEPDSEPKVTFARAVAALKVSMVGDGQFIAGGRSLRQGQSLKLSSGGTQFPARILSVSPSAIVFENTESGEKASLSVGGGLPAGMQSSGAGEVVPGMMPMRSAPPGP